MCSECPLVQLEEFVAPAETFTEYAYFSSCSDSWVKHARRYCQLMCERFNLGRARPVYGIAGNDGYLLQHFVTTGSSATASREKGNTLLNYCGIRSDFINFTVNRNPYKQGKFMPARPYPFCRASGSRRCTRTTP